MMKKETKKETLEERKETDVEEIVKEYMDLKEKEETHDDKSEVYNEAEETVEEKEEACVKEESNTGADKDKEIEALKKEIDLLKNKKSISSVGGILRIALVSTACCVAMLGIVFCIFNFVDKKNTRNKIDNNELYENLIVEEKQEYIDNIKNKLGSYYDTLGDNNGYCEAMDANGNYFSICYAPNNELMYTDNASFAYFSDKNDNTYCLGADSNGEFISTDIKRFDPIRFMKFAIDNEYGKAYYYSGEEESGNMYYSLSKSEFEKLVNDYSSKECKSGITFDEFREFIGLSDSSNSEDYNIVLGIGAYEDGVILDFIYVGAESYNVLYEANYFETLEEWSLGDDWYADGSDKLKLASNKMIEVIGYIDNLYSKYQSESNNVDTDSSSVSDNSVSENNP